MCEQREHDRRQQRHHAPAEEYWPMGRVCHNKRLVWEGFHAIRERHSCLLGFVLATHSHFVPEPESAAFAIFLATVRARSWSANSGASSATSRICSSMMTSANARLPVTQSRSRVTPQQPRARLLKATHEENILLPRAPQVRTSASLRPAPSDRYRRTACRLCPGERSCLQMEVSGRRHAP